MISDFPVKKDKKKHFSNLYTVFLLKYVNYLFIYIYMYIYVSVHFEYYTFPVNFNSDPHILKSSNKQQPNK